MEILYIDLFSEPTPQDIFSFIGDKPVEKFLKSNIVVVNYNSDEGLRQYHIAFEGGDISFVEQELPEAEECTEPTDDLRFLGNIPQAITHRTSGYISKIYD